MENKEVQSFSELLGSELKRRTAGNPSYSIRAFARQLKVDHSHLAKILKGQRTVSERFVDWTGWTLNWSQEAISKSKRLKGVTQVRTGRKLRAADDLKFNTISFNEFETISQLIHFTVMEMTELSNMKPKVSEIARRLGVPVGDVQAAVDRLLDLGALVETPEGIKSNRHFTTTTNAGTSEALKKLQTEILQRATQALTEVPIERREQSAITMAIDSKKIPEAKARIKKFRRELMEFLQDSLERDQVYQLSISLFPLERGE